MSWKVRIIIIVLLLAAGAGNYWYKNRPRKELVVQINRREADAPQPDLGATAIADADAVVKDVFKAEYGLDSQSLKQAFAARLLQEGMDASDHLAARYVLLREAADQAALAGDATTVMKALTEMSKSYVVDGPGLKADALARTAAAATTPDANKALAQGYLALFDDYLVAENFEGAKGILGPGEAAAKAGKSVPLVFEMQARGRELPEIQKIQTSAKAAADAAKGKPEDPALNTVLGRYSAIVRGDWEKGLPCLAQCSDPALQNAAKDELGRPNTPAEWTGVGDAWWNLAEKEKLLTLKAHLRAHACECYDKAKASLPQGTKAWVEKRLQMVRGAAEPAPKQ